MQGTALFQRTKRETHTLPKRQGSCAERQIVRLPVSKIDPNRSQPRRTFDNESLVRLADSIRQYGILQPITVRRVADGRFELIAGERRLRAAKLLGMLEVPCIITEVSERASAELAIIENIQREDLDMFEEAAAIASLIDIYGFTQEQAAKRLSLSQSYLANKLRLLRLTAEERDMILSEGLTERHARALLRVSDISERKAVAAHIAARRMNVAKTEAYIDKLLEYDPEPPAPKEKIVIKDIKLFYNSVDRAIDIVKRAGIDVISRKNETDDKIELQITIPKA